MISNYVVAERARSLTRQGRAFQDVGDAAAAEPLLRAAHNLYDESEKATRIALQLDIAQSVLEQIETLGASGAPSVREHYDSALAAAADALESLDKADCELIELTKFHCVVLRFKYVFL